jgi:dTMP kinase
MTKGLYIAFEGVVGTGKTTQSKRLVEELKQRFPNRVVLWTREPGGSEIAEAIRTVVQATPFTEPMDPVCEAYLYAAARAQSLRVTVKPVLDQGGIVITDRTFCTSVAWQGYGRGLDPALILAINKIAVGEFLPDIVFELDLDPVEGLKRTFDARGDKFETMPVEFFQQCVRGYRAMAESDLLHDRWKRINATGTRDEVYLRITEAVNPLLNNA